MLHVLKLMRGAYGTQWRFYDGGFVKIVNDF